MSSRPLFASVAESIVIFGPMFQVGCASACAGVTSASSSAVLPRNGPPDAVSTSAPPARANGPRGTGRQRRVLAVDRKEPPSPRSRAASASSPAATRLSLFASASASPRSSVQSVASSPAKPTTALRTTSGSARSSSSVRSPPTCVSGASPSIGGDPGSGGDELEPGCASMTSRAWRPIEPVAPSSGDPLVTGSLGRERLRRASGRPEATMHVERGDDGEQRASIRSSTPPCPAEQRARVLDAACRA